MNLLRQVAAELAATARRPRRLLELFRPASARRVARRVLGAGRIDLMRAPWQDEAGSGLARRRYRSYEQYVRHQRSKLDTLELSAYQERFRAVLGERLLAAGLAGAGRNALCLGARLGAEVQAFHDAGWFAVGIDLNPGPDNPYVLPGDFHHLVFPDGSVDAVYTNALDHALEPERLLAEVRRVLAPGGLLVAEVAETGGSGEYEALSWSSLEDLVGFFARCGFRELGRSPFDFPWGGGVQLRLAPGASAAGGAGAGEAGA